jgi:hypothetical protein
MTYGRPDRRSPERTGALARIATDHVARASQLADDSVACKIDIFGDTATICRNENQKVSHGPRR